MRGEVRGLGRTVGLEGSTHPVTGPAPWRRPASSALATSRAPMCQPPIGVTCGTLAAWLRRDANAPRPSARSLFGRRSSASSARVRGPPTSSRVSSGSRRSRSPIISPTSPAPSDRRRSGFAWSRPGVSAAASSSESGTASTDRRPVRCVGVSTSTRHASPSSRDKRPSPISHRRPSGRRTVTRRRFRLEALRAAPPASVILCALGAVANHALTFAQDPGVTGTVARIVLVGGVRPRLHHPGRRVQRAHCGRARSPLDEADRATSISRAGTGGGGPLRSPARAISARR